MELCGCTVPVLYWYHDWKVPACLDREAACVSVLGQQQEVVHAMHPVQQEGVHVVQQEDVHVGHILFT